MSAQKLALAGAAAAAACAALLASLVVVAAGAASAPETTARPPVCTTTGDIPQLSAAQAQNARTVYATAAARGGRPAAYISLLVGLTESNLLILSNPNDASGNGIRAQGVGYDHDSLGIFQQRPGWGTAAQRMDAVASTNLFLDALLRLPGWDTIDPWVAAQRVQRSAFEGRPNASNHYSAVFGGNYLKQTGRAQQVLATIDSAAATLDCGAAEVDGGAVSLPVDGAPLDSATSPQAAAAVAFALAQRGKPYVWGGAGPNSYDCSGLMQTAWRHAGVAIGRVTSQQVHDGVPTTMANLRPGDLVMIPGSAGTLAQPEHVGMYIGAGKVLHAPRTGDVVKVVELRWFIGKGVSGYRHIA